MKCYLGAFLISAFATHAAQDEVNKRPAQTEHLNSGCEENFRFLTWLLCWLRLDKKAGQCCSACLWRFAAVSLHLCYPLMQPHVELIIWLWWVVSVRENLSLRLRNRPPLPSSSPEGCDALCRDTHDSLACLFPKLGTLPCDPCVSPCPRMAWCFHATWLSRTDGWL